ncbi:MAG: ABC transporter substrate-binding protein [Lachnospiraceae bacterium]|nr:ABC transporter substrate-binding protein [Lachnospiraceae bacterium]
MKKTNRLMAMAFAGVMAFLLAGCSSKPAETTAAAAETTAAPETNAAESKGETTVAADAADGKTFKIGVIQLVQHEALDSSNKGFFAALDDAGIQYEVDQQNASGEQANCLTIAEKLVNDGNDLILAIATPAAQAVAGVTEDIPILLTAVTDPAASGLVNDNAKPGVNVSGTSDLTPVKEQIELLQQILPDAKHIGLLYCSAESNSELQIAMAKEACDAAGITYEEYTVPSSNEIQSVVESMVGKIDALYMPTDNTIAAGIATVAMVANDNKIPTICGEAGMVNGGGLATYGIDYYQLGYLAGEQAIDILVNGADIKEIPIGYLPADRCELTVNKTTAEALGIDISGLDGAVVVE